MCSFSMYYYFKSIQECEDFCRRNKIMDVEEFSMRDPELFEEDELEDE